MRLDETSKVISSVVIRQFFTGRDAFLGVNMHLSLVFREEWFTVGSAAVVDVAGEIVTTFTVDSPMVVELKEVFAAAPVGFCGGDGLASVFDH